MSKYFNDVFERDNHRCVYCGRDLLADFESFLMAEEDHLVPQYKGGDSSVENIVTACSTCNQLKGKYAPDDISASENKAAYFTAVRAHVMNRRAEKMRDFLSWAIHEQEHYYNGK